MLLFKLLAIAGYFLFAVAYFVVCITLLPIHLYAVAPIFLWILVFFTWRYVSYDYYFEFKSGTLELGTIRGSAKGRKRRVRRAVHIKDASLCERYSGDAKSLGQVNEVADFSGSRLSQNRVAVVYEQNGKNCAVIFECTSKCANLLAAFNPVAKSLKGQTFYG